MTAPQKGRVLARSPFSPVCWLQADQFLFRVGAHPSAENAAAWEYNGMRAIVIENGEFDIAVEGCSCNAVPLAITLLRGIKRS